MTRPGYEAARAMRKFLREGDWSHVKAWLEECIKVVESELYATTDQAAVNRLVGEHRTISTLIVEVENSPESEALLANADSSPEPVQGAVGWSNTIAGESLPL